MRVKEREKQLLELCLEVVKEDHDPMYKWYTGGG